MKDNLFNRLVYLDHNVLDQMTKGDTKKIHKFLDNGEFIAVYSSENLNEIKRSKGYEDSFLNVLRVIGARHIVPNMDNNFHYVGTAQVIEGDPTETYKSYIKNTNEMPEFGYGMSGMLKKMYGGLEDHTFSEIFEKGIEEISKLTEIPEEYIDELNIDTSQKEDIKKYFQMLPNILRHSSSDLGKTLDKDSVESHVKEFEKTTGIGPKVLKNISGPNILNKIWDHVQRALPGVEITLDKFFGLDQSDWSNTPERKISIVEKVNSIYNQLNYIGYFRDSSMKKERRFTASFSDMTHAGMATFCKLFICRDEDLVMKAATAYEYLGLQTKILHIKN